MTKSASGSCPLSESFRPPLPCWFPWQVPRLQPDFESTAMISLRNDGIAACLFVVAGCSALISGIAASTATMIVAVESLRSIIGGIVQELPSVSSPEWRAVGVNPTRKQRGIPKSHGLVGNCSKTVGSA